MAYFCSHISEINGDLHCEQLKPCLISLSIGRCLLAHMLSNRLVSSGIPISQMLRDNENHVVFGYVTSEQSIMDMCYYEEIDGYDNDWLTEEMSMLAIHCNPNECGYGMYFVFTNIGFRSSDA